MDGKPKYVALVLSLNKRFDRKVIGGVTRFVHESGLWSVFLEDDPAAKVPDFSRGNFDGVIADLDDPRIPQRVAGLAVPVVGIGGIDPGSPLIGTLSTVGTDNRRIADMATDYLLRRGRQEAFSARLEEAGHPCAVYGGRYHPSRSWERLQESLRDWLAVRLERKLKWDPKTESFVNDDEANARFARELHNGWKLVS
jgi:DNA-binding LacI/PurR family transcriptional regulator